MDGISVAPCHGATSSASRDPSRRGSQGKQPAAIGLDRRPENHQKGTTSIHARMLHRASNMFFFMPMMFLFFRSQNSIFRFFPQKPKRSKHLIKTLCENLRKLAETCGTTSYFGECFLGFNIFSRRKSPKSFEKKGRKFPKLFLP